MQWQRTPPPPHDEILTINGRLAVSCAVAAIRMTFAMDETPTFARTCAVAEHNPQPLQCSTTGVWHAAARWSTQLMIDFVYAAAHDRSWAAAEFRIVTLPS